MKPKSYIHGIGILIALSFLLQSCVKNDISLSNVDGTIGINGSLVFPVANSTITISQFLNHQNVSNLSQNNTGAMFLYYSPTTYTLNFNQSGMPITIPSYGIIDLSFMYNAIQPISTLPFSNPQFGLILSNRTNSPLTFKIDSISSYNSSRSSEKSTVKSFSLDTLHVQSSSTDTLILDKNNGHMDSLFLLPGINTMTFDFSVSFQKAFLSPCSIKISPYVVLPLSFNRGADIIMSDTISINNQSFHDFLNKTNVNELALWLIANNNTSSQINVTASLLNTNRQTIGNPQTVTLKVTANVDANGRPMLTSGTQTDQDFKLSFNYSDLQQANYIMLTYTLQGKDITSPFAVNASDFVKVKVSAYAKGISFTH